MNDRPDDEASENVDSGASSQRAKEIMARLEAMLPADVLDAAVVEAGVGSDGHAVVEVNGTRFFLGDQGDLLASKRVDDRGRQRLAVFEVAADGTLVAKGLVDPPDAGVGVAPPRPDLN